MIIISFTLYSSRHNGAVFPQDGLAVFNPQNIVVFGYSFNFVEMENLKTNVKILRDSEKNLKINLDIRY